MSDDLYLPVKIEALVSVFLREQPEIEALIPHDDYGARVYTALPKDAVYPLIRVTQIIDTPAPGQPLWNVRYDVQVEAYGGTKDQAWSLAAVARAAIDVRLPGTHEGRGIVSGTSPAGMMDLPDDEYTPAKPRWLFTSTIYAHPIGSIAS